MNSTSEQIDPILHDNNEFKKIYNNINNNPINNISSLYNSTLPDKKLIDSLSRQVYIIRSRQLELFQDQIKRFPEHDQLDNKNYSDFANSFETKEKSTLLLLGKMREMTGWIDDLHSRVNPKN